MYWVGVVPGLLSVVTIMIVTMGVLPLIIRSVAVVISGLLPLVVVHNISAVSVIIPV